MKGGLLWLYICNAVIVPLWWMAMYCCNWWPSNNGKTADIERDVGDLTLENINGTINDSLVQNDETMEGPTTAGEHKTNEM